jgi:hypothetical protein
MASQPAPVVNVAQPSITVNPPAVSVGDVNVHIPERKVHLHVEEMEQEKETNRELLKQILEYLKMPVKPVKDKLGRTIGAIRVKSLDE